MKEALELIGKLGISGGFGFLFGLLLVWWVEPTTTGGIGLLIVISIIIFTTAGAIVSKIVASKTKGKASEDEDKVAAKSTPLEAGRASVEYPPC